LAQKNNIQHEVENWPWQVTHDVKLKRMCDYFRNSMWQKQPVCAVCTRDHYGTPSTTYQLQQNDKLPSGFRTFLSIPHHSVHYGRDEFVFGHCALDNMMLCRQGIESSEHTKFKVHVCEDHALTQNPQSIMFLQNCQNIL